MMMKRKWKPFLAAVLTGAVLIASGCKGKTESGNDEKGGTSEAVQDDIPQLEDGTLEGNVFTNRWADFVITFPDDTEFWSEDDLREQEKQIKESNPSLNVFKYDFAAVVSGENIFELTYEGIAKGSTLESYVKETEESLEEAGYAIVDKGSINLGGSEYSFVRSEMKMVEVSFGYDYYIRQVDDTYMCLTVFYRMDDGKKIQDILGTMKPWKKK
ncbi:hypothetical protein [Clostridium sp. AM58-1XD]|uniref:hypothetical protein n=1 Tax=Clostridium sp. AM58-1XD TaxID=2292307 RepID=UPI000E466FAC|nr:hypothetical protein [Clostridium sp. AM58-1XD]RGZ00963.1 hypothetical protein DXA13_03590 [Clostridium sp. AM58-1XD]